jgi:hypothetical protein
MCCGRMRWELWTLTLQRSSLYNANASMFDMFFVECVRETLTIRRIIRPIPLLGIGVELALDQKPDSQMNVSEFDVLTCRGQIIYHRSE